MLDFSAAEEGERMTGFDLVGIRTPGFATERFSQINVRDYQWFIDGNLTYRVRRDPFVTYELSDMEWMVPLGLAVCYSDVVKVNLSELRNRYGLGQSPGGTVVNEPATFSDPEAPIRFNVKHNFGVIGF